MTNLPKTRLQMAAEYAITPKTFVRKLKYLGIKLPPGDIMPADQARIYKALGEAPLVPPPPKKTK